VAGSSRFGHARAHVDPGLPFHNCWHSYEHEQFEGTIAHSIDGFAEALEEGIAFGEEAAGCDDPPQLPA